MIARCLVAGSAIVLAISVAAAQESSNTAPKAPTAAKAAPNTVKTTRISPDGKEVPNSQGAAKQAPADTASALASPERLSLQSDLAWTGSYNGLINGEVSDRLVASIKAWQKDHGAKETGALNPQERTTLATEAKTAQVRVGWKMVSDFGSGMRLGLPEKLLPTTRVDSAGTRYSSSSDTIVVTLTKRREQGLTLAAMAEREKKEPAGRKIEYSALRPDYYVISGSQGLKRLYVRGQIKNGEIRTMTVLYDQATEGTMGPIVVAMSSAFNPFPGAADATQARKTVEYATGTIVSDDGVIVTDRASVDGCNVITVAGYGNAARLAEDAVRDLALVRLYGVRTAPLAIATSAAPKNDLVLTGIADPQNQNGGAAVTSLKIQTAANSGQMTLPPPAAGFYGAPALDNDGRFAGLVVSKSAAAATLVSADAVQAFLAANGVSPANTAGDAKASVVRLICVRS